MRLFSKLVVVSWSVAFSVFFDNLFGCKYSYLEAIVGSFLDLETAVSLKSFFNSFGCSNINYQYNNSYFSDFRFSYLLSTSLVALENLDFCFFFGLNLRAESPLLNYRLRKSFLASDGSFMCFSLGLSVDALSFPVYNIGNSMSSLFDFFSGRSFFFSSFLLRSEMLSFKFLNYNFSFFDKASFFMGSSFLSSRYDITFFFNAFSYMVSQNVIFMQPSLNVISSVLGRISAFELGLVPGINSYSYVNSLVRTMNSFIYFLGTEDFVVDSSLTNVSNFFVYQGSFYSTSNFFSFLNLLFPVSIYTERVSSYLNVEGRFRRTQKAIEMPLVYSDWEVLKALFVFRTNFFNFNFSIFGFDSTIMGDFFSHLIDYSCIFFYNFNIIKTVSTFVPLMEDQQTAVVSAISNYPFLSSGVSKVFNTLFSRSFNDYYNSDFFSRNSKLLSICFSKIASSTFSRYNA